MTELDDVGRGAADDLLARVAKVARDEATKEVNKRLANLAVGGRLSWEMLTQWGHRISDNGVAVPIRPNLDLVGFTVADVPAGDLTRVTGGGSWGARVLYEEYAPASGTFFVPLSYPQKRLLVVSINSNVQSLVNLADVFISWGPTLGINIVASGSVVGVLYEATHPTDRGLVYSDPGSGKCLSLWNGSSNDSPPSGWEDIAFSDDAWAAPVAAHHWFDDDTVGDFILGARNVWPTVRPAHINQKALFRHSFTLSSSQLANTVKAQLRVFVDDLLLSVSVNGHAISPNVGLTLDGQGPMIGFYLPLDWFVVGANVVAIQGQDGTDGPPGEAHVGYRLDID